MWLTKTEEEKKKHAVNKINHSRPVQVKQAGLVGLRDTMIGGQNVFSY